MISPRDNIRSRSRFWIIGGCGALLVLVGVLFVPAVGNVARNSLRGVWWGRNAIVSGIESVGSFFYTKKSLQRQIETLKRRESELQIEQLQYSLVLKENEELKNALGRQVGKEFILGTILVKPNRSPYDTIILDVGNDLGVKEGALVFAYGNTPVGMVSSVSSDTSIVTLFSTSGQKTIGRVETLNIDVELVGRGGGNFELIVPRQVAISTGMKVFLPSLETSVIATVSESITDARDPEQTFLLTAPVNINELHSVYIEK